MNLGTYKWALPQNDSIYCRCSTVLQYNKLLVAWSIISMISINKLYLKAAKSCNQKFDWIDLILVREDILSLPIPLH